MRHFHQRRTSESDQSGTLASGREQAVLRAAFSLLAERGFEGLRMREVALRSRLNVATLHYYFPSKHDLIVGISRYLAKQFVTTHAPDVAKTNRPALDWLRQGFADAEFYARSDSQLTAVSQEFALRARRDRFVQEVMDKLIQDWRRAVRKMLKAGIADGTFRSDIDLAATANLLAAVFSGVAYLQPQEIPGVGAVVEALLIAKT